MEIPMLGEAAMHALWLEEIARRMAPPTPLRVLNANIRAAQARELYTGLPAATVRSPDGVVGVTSNDQF